MQVETYTFNKKQLEGLEKLFISLRIELENKNITLIEAKGKILNRVKDYIDVVYEIVNGNFNLLDDNIEYPINSGNQVIGGLLIRKVFELAQQLK